MKHQQYINWYVKDESKSIRPHCTSIDIQAIENLVELGFITSREEIQEYIKKEVLQDFLRKVSFCFDETSATDELISRNANIMKNLNKYNQEDVSNGSIASRDD